MSRQTDRADDLLDADPWGYDATKRIEGAEDWIYVASAEIDGGYDWDEIHVFYSPSARRFFWRSASGCSCSSWSTSLHGISDFQDGDRDAAIRAVTTWAEDTYQNVIAKADRARDAIRAFRPSKAEKDA